MKKKLQYAMNEDEYRNASKKHGISLTYSTF